MHHFIYQIINYIKILNNNYLRSKVRNNLSNLIIFKNNKNI